MKHNNLDHDQMAENQMADRYLMGKLTHEENDWFENHFPTCETCMAELELAEALQKAVKIDAGLPLDAGLSLNPAHKQRPAPLWGALGLAAGLLLGLLFPFLKQDRTGPSLDLEFQEFSLIAQRSSDSDRENIVFTDKDHHIGLRFATPAPNTSYRLVFLNEANQTVFQSGETRANQPYKLVLLKKDLFAPGIYTLNIETIDENSEATPFAQYRLQIQHQD